MFNQKGFSEKMKNFASSEEPENFFAKAKAIYLNRLNEAITQKYMWQRAFFGALLLSGMLAGGMIYLTFNTPVKIHIVEVDSQSGMVRNVGLAKEELSKPNDEVNKYFVGQFVEKVRTIPLDPLLYDKNWTEARMLMTAGTGSKMAQVMSSDPEMSNAYGKRTVLPKILSIVPVTKDSYQCRWSEEHFQLNGTGSKENRIMTGIFTVEFSKPTEKEIGLNPLGMRIKDFSWQIEKK